MSYYPFLFFFQLFNGLLLIAALLSRKGNRLPNLILSGVIATALYVEWVGYLMVTDEIARVPYFLRTQNAASLLTPAFFYLYCLSLTVPNFHWEKTFNLYFLPFLAGVIWYGAVFILGRSRGYWEWPRPHPFERYALVTFCVLVYGAFLAASFIQLRSYESRLKDYFSQFRRVRLSWLRVFLGLLTLPWIVGLLDVANGPYITMERWIIPVVALMVLLMGFWGLRQSIIFAPDEGWEEPKAVPPCSIFSAEEMARWKERLEKYVQEEKPYLNPELRLVDVARGLKLKTYQVSEILNRGMGTSFYELMNRHRVEEVQRKLLDPAFSHYNLLGIAMESGFNSKSVFNETFRKIAGSTPTEYRKSKLS